MDLTINYKKSAAPKLSVQEAVLKAAQYLAEPAPDAKVSTDQYGQPRSITKVDLKGFTPTVITSNKSEAKMDTVLDSGPFGDKFKANLV